MEKTNKQEKSEFIEKMIAVNRVTKVIKGGRVLRFSAVMVVGDGDGRVGMGTGKAREVLQAAQKATEKARRNMVKINLVNSTIHHAVKGRHGASSIFMQPASPGTGIIAAVRRECFLKPPVLRIFWPKISVPQILTIFCAPL